jgi:hypothetical protein
MPNTHERRLNHTSNQENTILGMIYLFKQLYWQESQNGEIMLSYTDGESKKLVQLLC